MVRRIRARLSLFLLAALATTGASGDHPTIAFGSESSGPIVTIPGVPLAKGQWTIGLRTEVIEFDAFRDAELTGFAASGREGVHSIDRLANTSVAIGYGLSEDLTISLRFPYSDRKNIREGEIEGGTPEVHAHGDSSGAGDASVFGMYRFVKANDLDASLLFGVKTSSGRTDVKDDGTRLETELQPGTGSRDVLVGVAVSRQDGGLGYHANVLYHHTTEGSQDTEIGDSFFYNAALSYRLAQMDHSHGARADDTAHGHLAWDVLLELNARSQRMNKTLGIDDDNSGGTVVFLSPGLRLSAASGWSGFLSLGVPISEKLKGEQTDTRYRLIAGVSVVL